MSINSEFSRIVKTQIQSHFADKFAGGDTVPEIAPKHVAEAASITFKNKLFEVSFDEYKEVHKTGDAILRKITALPLALFGIAQFIYKFALGAQQSLTCKNSEYKAHLYGSIRSLQETIGHIVTIFNDTYGSYLVASAQAMSDFHVNQSGERDAWTNPLLRREVKLLEDASLNVVTNIMANIKENINNDSGKGDFKATITLPGQHIPLAYNDRPMESVKKAILVEVYHAFDALRRSDYLYTTLANEFANCKIEIAVGKFDTNNRYEYNFTPESIHIVENFIRRDENGLNHDQRVGVSG
jgi:hypothetical protein